MKNTKRRSLCPVSYFLDFFGDKWTLLVFRDLLIFKKRHFKEFISSKEGVATNILSDRLVKLESYGIITKTKDAKKHSQNIYTLTTKGRDLAPTITEMMKWSAKYDKQCPAINNAKEQGLESPSALIDELMSHLA